MDITFDVVAFLLGCTGAFFHESLRWIGLRTDDRLPTYFRKLHYWLLTLLLVLLGGALSSLLSPSNAIQAISFGITAPSILTRLGTLSNEEETLGTETSEQSTQTSLRDFLRG